VLVFGSLPPEGRDLDILARPGQRKAIAAALTREGLLTKDGARWVAFGGCTAVGVDLVLAADWRLPDRELDSVFEEARVLAGYTHLAAPAAPHALLIAARRVARAGRYGEKLRARVEATAREQPSAWQEAEARAPAWHAERELAALRALHSRGGAPALGARLRSAAGRLRDAKGKRRRVAARTMRRLTGRPMIVALSGLDGAGKSFQAKRLADALLQLDYRVAVVWPPAANVMFQANPALKRRLFGLLHMLGRGDAPKPRGSSGESPARRGAGPLPGETSGPVDEPSGPPGEGAAPEPLPPQRAPVAQGLALVVALVQAWSFRRGARGSARRADVIIFDRYVLDSVVYLRHRWGHGRAFPLQSALMRLLTRRPDCAFFLDVAPEVAYARKRDFPLENLRERAALYSALHGRLGSVRLDGERTPEDLCGEIAAVAWQRLA